MYKYMHIYMHIRTHVHIYTHIYICVHTYVIRFTNVYTTIAYFVLPYVYVAYILALLTKQNFFTCVGFHKDSFKTYVHNKIIYLVWKKGHMLHNLYKHG